MRDQSGKCILQRVSQSMGAPSVMYCAGRERKRERGRETMQPVWVCSRACACVLARAQGTEAWHGWHAPSRA